MEVVMQWLDELDDLVSMVAAKSENLRRLVPLISTAFVAALALALGATATLMQPAAAPLTASLLGVAYLYQRQQDRIPAKS